MLFLWTNFMASIFQTPTSSVSKVCNQKKHYLRSPYKYAEFTETIPMVSTQFFRLEYFIKHKQTVWRKYESLA